LIEHGPMGDWFKVWEVGDTYGGYSDIPDGSIPVIFSFGATRLIQSPTDNIDGIAEELMIEINRLVVEDLELLGCTDPGANNYNSSANIDDSSCVYDGPIVGCMDPDADNYQPEATEDDGSCVFTTETGGFNLKDLLVPGGILVVLGVIFKGKKKNRTSK